MMKNTMCFIVMLAGHISMQSLATEHDYDGDKHADIVFRNIASDDLSQVIVPSTLYAEDEQTIATTTKNTLGGEASDIPISADYDGDGLWDYGVYRPSTSEWIIHKSSTSETSTTIFDQGQTVIPVPADYNGDGIDDVAVRRPSTFTWYIRNSDGLNFNSERGDGIQRVVFGRDSNDIPLVADYDGDNFADIAVLRNSNSTVYIKNSTGTAFNSARGDDIQRVSFSNTITSSTEGSLLPLAQNPGDIFTTITAALDTEDYTTMPTASYKVVFRTFFNAEHFPTQLPGNPHFSSVVGMTHMDGVELWETAGIASDGIEIMAETGGTSRLLAELEEPISEGLAEFSIRGPGLGSNPESTEFEFTLSEGFPLVSLVTMVAPSPDWFVGVKNLSLKDANGNWLREVHVPLPTYDSGTDNGDTFVAVNSDTNPREPIQLLSTNPEYSDFLNGFQRTTGQSIASFTFILQ